MSLVMPEVLVGHKTRKEAESCARLGVRWQDLA